jgi:hypothetical protein
LVKLFLLSAALLAATVVLQPRVWALPATPTATSRAAPSPDPIPARLRRLGAFGYSKILADWVWLKAIQYYGSRENQKYRYNGLAPLLDEVTDLDPTFEYAFQFAGQSVPYHDENTGLWHNTNAAIALLRKGASAAPSRWQIPWLLGFNLYTFQGNYVEAGRAMEHAAHLPGAPPFMNSLAARLLVQGSDVDTAIFITQSALSDASDERTKDDLETRLKSLILQRDLDQLNAALAERSKVAPVTSLSELVGAAGVSSIPPDPFGGHYALDQTSGTVTSTHHDKLLRLYVHPGSPAIEPVAD